MKERLVTFLCALGALLLFIAMFGSTESSFDPGREAARPTTAERRGNGYYAAISWLESENIRTISLRERFTSLTERDDIPPTGNLLIVTLPATTGFQTAEFLPLDRWVRAGNTLFVLAALSDNPDWALRHAGLTPGDLNLLTGLEFESTRNRESRLTRTRQQRRTTSATADASGASITPAEPFMPLPEPERTAFVPNRGHVFFENVSEGIALSDFPRQTWTMKVPYEGFALVLAHERESGEGVFWTRPLGNGRIIVSAFGTPFTNRALGLGDNARLLSNIVAATVAPNGVVLFDDAHQGLGTAYDPDMFYADPRLHITLAILIGLWLTWVVGSTRLRVPVTRAPTPREADLVRTTGSFFSRVLRRDVAARRLFDHFFRQLHTNLQQSQQPSETWEYLERHPRVSGADVRQLKELYAAAREGKRVPLRKLHDIMVRVHRQIA